MVVLFLNCNFYIQGFCHKTSNLLLFYQKFVTFLDFIFAVAVGGHCYDIFSMVTLLVERSSEFSIIAYFPYFISRYLWWSICLSIDLSQFLMKFNMNIMALETTQPLSFLISCNQQYQLGRHADFQGMTAVPLKDSYRALKFWMVIGALKSL
jgi:hypothetical protein